MTPNWTLASTRSSARPVLRVRARLLTYAELHDIELVLRRIRRRSREYYVDAIKRSGYEERRAGALRRLAEALGPDVTP